MRTIIDTVLIRADPEMNLTKSLGVNKLTGEEIKVWIDPAFNPHASEHVTQEGEIVTVPHNLSKKFGEIDIQAGDYVFCHHFLTDKDASIDGNVFRLDYGLIYGKRVDKGIEMIGAWNFLETIEEIDTRSFVPEAFKKNISSTTGTAKYLSKKMQGQLKEGDTVIFRKNMNYSMFVDGTEYLRVHDNDLCATLEG